MKISALFAALGAGALLLATCGPASQATPAPTQTAAMPQAPTSTPAPKPTSQAPSGAIPIPVSQVTPTAAPRGTPTGSTPQYGGLLRTPVRGDPDTWKPFGTAAAQSAITRTAVFSRMFTFWSDPPQNCKTPAYQVALKSWKWVDDRTAEFTLQAGMRYQNKPPVNGREVTAQDLAYSIPLWKGVSTVAQFTTEVESLEAVDRSTLRVRLKAPHGGWPVEFMGGHHGLLILPPEAGGADNSLWEQPEKSWIGSGPFAFKTWSAGVKWTLERNSGYFTKGKPYIDGVEYMVMPDFSAQMAALRAGKLDFAYELPFMVLDELTARGFQSIRCPGTGVSGFDELLLEQSTPPFNDVRVRRAISMAIDRETIAKTIYGGFASIYPVLPSALPIAMGWDEFPPETRQYLEYHPDKAKPLLAEAYPQGLDTVLNWSPRYLAPTQQVVEAVVEMLGRAGVRAKIGTLDYAFYQATINASKMKSGEMAQYPYLANTPEAQGALSGPYTPQGLRASNYAQDKEYDRLFEAYKASTNPGEQKELARKMQLRIADQTLRVLLPIPDSTMTSRRGLHLNWVGGTRDFGPMLENIWSEK